MTSDLSRRCTTALIAALIVFAASGCSSASNPLCEDTDENAKAVTRALAAAKQSLADAHNARAKQQSQAIEKRAATCIDADENADNFRYIHAYAAMIEAQARMASGDVNGMTIMQNATDEAQTLASKSGVDHDLQKMATNLVTMANYEKKEIQAAKRGDLIKPPPTPTP